LLHSSAPENQVPKGEKEIKPTISDEAAVGDRGHRADERGLDAVNVFLGEPPAAPPQHTPKSE